MSPERTREAEGVQMCERVWYVAYGSNLAADRFRCYLEGGTPDGGALAYPGARDRSLPTASRAVVIPGALYFALESVTWTGGMAFYDPDPDPDPDSEVAADGGVAARAWQIGVDQFADVLSQEMHRPVGTLALPAVPVGGRVAVGPGRYETLMHLGELDGCPMLTLTAPWRAGDVTHTRPGAAYLRVIGRGLRESHGWTDAQVRAYLSRWVR